MTDRKRVYWDACAWLGLLNKEGGKFEDLEVVWRKAQHGELEIWTSAFCIAEVHKVKCADGSVSLDEADDAKIDNLFDQDFVFLVHLDTDIARLAKKLLRDHAKLRKPSDAVHLATAVNWNLDQLHTYDHSDLIGLDVARRDGQKLEICRPNLVDGENLFTGGGGDAG